MSKLLNKIGQNSKIAFRNRINLKKRNKVLKDFCNLIIKNKQKIIFENKTYEFIIHC